MEELEYNLKQELFQVLELRGDLNKLCYLVEQAQNQINTPDADPEEISQGISEIKRTIPTLELVEIAKFANDFQEYDLDDIVPEMALYNTQLVEFSQNNSEMNPIQIADEVSKLTLNQTLIQILVRQLFRLKGKFDMPKEESVKLKEFLAGWLQHQLFNLGIKNQMASSQYLDDQIEQQDKVSTPKSNRSRSNLAGDVKKNFHARKFSHTPQAKGLDGLSSNKNSKAGLGALLSQVRLGADVSTQPSTQMLNPNTSPGSLPQLNVSPSVMKDMPSKSSLKIKNKDSQSNLSKKNSSVSVVEQSPKSEKKMGLSFQIGDTVSSVGQQDQEDGMEDEDEEEYEKSQLSQKSKKSFQPKGLPKQGPRYSVLDPTGKMRNPMAVECIDLTHDCPVELHWRPIIRVPDKKPLENVLKDKLLLKDWEMVQLNEWYSFIWDRRIIDNEIIRRFKAQGDIIKTTPAQTLANDLNFWKQEAEIYIDSQRFIKNMKKLRPYDYFMLRPEVYDMRANQTKESGVPAGGGAKEKGQKEPVQREQKEGEGDDDVNNLTLVGKPDEEQRQAGQLNTAVESMAAEGGGFVFSRGPEVEVAGNKEVESLMQVLSKLNIQLSNKVLQRAIVMPKDREQNSGSYPKVIDGLMHNPYGTAEYKRLEAARKKIEANKQAAEAKAEKATNKKNKKSKKLDAIAEDPVGEN